MPPRSSAWSSAAVVLFLAFGSLAASALPIATALVGVGTRVAPRGSRCSGTPSTITDFAPMLGSGSWDSVSASTTRCSSSPGTGGAD